ncbi:unnamed protein product [Rhizophagus irregularis]|nr:unnamed protein product [Rhizophagus irregularis]
MTFEHSQEVSNDYEKLFEIEKGHDVIICAGENENMKEIRAHSLILCTRSQYFCAAFYNDWVEKKNGIFIFNKPNISPQLFKIILRFIYCGKIDLTNFRGPELLKLLMAVDELNIQTLVTCVQKHLINDKEFLQENFMEILQMVYHNELFTGLLNYCLEEIDTIFNSDKIINLEAPLLEFLLKQDDLNLDEIEIWDDKNNLRNVHVAYSNGSQYSVRGYSHCGPLFGLNDLYINYNNDPNNWYHFGSGSYPTINIPNRINVGDYEIYIDLQ